MSDDLIRRSDAIEALRKRWAMTVSYNGIGEDIGEECAEAIETTPTVNSSEWIPCSERLPEEEGRYLCTNSMPWHGPVSVNEWVGDGWLYELNEPIAWMELPEPYREEQD